MDFSKLSLNGIEYNVKDAKARPFKNVGEMKSIVDLVAGDVVNTIGYYEPNDGGGATYLIRTKTESDVIDNGLIHLLNNGLVAELIINDCIEINKLGAKHNGEEDSSLIFNRAFEYINDQWLKGNYKINTIVCSGTYLWSNQVKMPPCARLNNDGFVTILTNVSNNSALHINYLSKNLPENFAGNKQDWQYATLINFDKGCVFKNISGDLTGSCIEIGTTSDYGSSYPICRYKLSNFRIYNYDIGIKHNMYHVYIGKYENISFEGNNIGVQYGTSNANVTDSGENMVYEQCLFANGINAVKWLTDGFDSSFTNCSFDYLKEIFVDANSKGFKRISLVNCHLESFEKIMPFVSKHTIVDISFSNIVDTKRGVYFPSAEWSGTVHLNNNNILPTTSNVTNPEKIYQNVTKIIDLNNNKIGNEEVYLGFIGTSNKFGNCFDGLDDGEITLSVGGKIGDWTVTNYSTNSIKQSASIVTDNYLYTGHKSLVLKSNSAETTSKTFHIESDFIPISNERVVYVNGFTHNSKRGCNITIYQYDINKKLIGNTNNYHYNINETNIQENEWYSSSYGKSCSLYANCSFIKVGYQFFNLNGGKADAVDTEYKIGGFCCN